MYLMSELDIMLCGNGSLKNFLIYVRRIYVIY